MTASQKTIDSSSSAHVIALTGATGFIGSHLVPRLLSEGFRLRCLVRTKAKAKLLQQRGVEIVFGDLNNIAALESLCRGVSRVIHNAALVTAPTLHHLWVANVKGTRNVCEALKKEGLSGDRGGKPRVIFISSQEAAGLKDGTAPFSEEDQPNPCTDYGKTKLQAEQVLVKYSEHLDWIALRLAPVFGPRDSDTLVLFKLISNRIKPSIRFTSDISVLYVENGVEAITRAVKTSAGDGRAYFVSDPDVVSLNILARLVARASGKRPRLVLPVYLWHLWLLGMLIRAWMMIMGGRIILTPQKVKVMAWHNLKTDASAFRSVFGEFSLIPMATALENTYHWYKREGWI